MLSLRIVGRLEKLVRRDTAFELDFGGQETYGKRRLIRRAGRRDSKESNRYKEPDVSKLGTRCRTSCPILWTQ